MDFYIMDYVYAILGISIDVALLVNLAKVLEKRRSWWQALTAYVLYGLAVLAMNAGGVSVVIKMLLCAFMIYIILGIVYEHSERSIRVGIAILYITILCIPELLILFSVMLFGLGMSSVENLNSNPLMWFLCMSIAKIWTYLIVVLILKMHRSRQNTRKRFAGIVQYGSVFITWFLLMLMAFMLVNLDKMRKEDVIFVLGMTTIATFLYTLAYNVFIQMYIESREKDYENKVLKEKNDLQCKYYSNKIYIEAEMNKIYHDLKNYTLMLNRRNAKATDLSNNITQLTDHYKKHIDTGNEMLNIILSEKKSVAEQYQIKLASIVRIPDWCPLSDVEICTIFGNLIDNAIEASVQIEQIERRKITIKGYMTSENALAFKISNNYIKPIRKEGDRFLSTKYKSGHGIGLNNVRGAISKHRGHFSVHTSEGVFEVSILFFKDVMG